MAGHGPTPGGEIIVADVGHGSSVLIVESHHVTLIDVALGSTVRDLLLQLGISRVQTRRRQSRGQ